MCCYPTLAVKEQICLKNSATHTHHVVVDHVHAWCMQCLHPAYACPSAHPYPNMMNIRADTTHRSEWCVSQTARFFVRNIAVLGTRPNVARFRPRRPRTRKYVCPPFRTNGWFFWCDECKCDCARIAGRLRRRRWEWCVAYLVLYGDGGGNIGWPPTLSTRCCAIHSIPNDPYVIHFYAHCLIQCVGYISGHLNISRTKQYANTNLELMQWDTLTNHHPYFVDSSISSNPLRQICTTCPNHP